MNSPSGLKPLGAAALMAGLALASAFVFWGILRHSSAQVSHQQPAEEHWLDPATPTSPALVTRGRAAFLDSCAHCHGADARGDEGPDLHAVQVSDRYISRIITHGIPYEMPWFAKKHQVEDITALTAYVRSLN